MMNHSKRLTTALSNKNSRPRVFIFFALACEAKALIQFFDLKKDLDTHLYSIYKTDDILLTVTGVGKVAMAGAVAYSLALFNSCRAPAIINIGIAGHKTYSIGKLVRVAKIIDDDTGKVHYPPIVGKNVADTAVLKTVSKAVIHYEADQLYDMEASAFYETAIRFSSSELVHCIKVV
jgi:hypothetical protein